VLARTTLVTTEYETYNIAYEYLLRATKLLGLSPSSDHPSSPPDLANYVRCTSGAYHNLAGTLYQDGKHVGAVRFLKEGCALGGRALVLRGRGGDEVEQTEGEGKGEEGWKLLREQLYRRWELLGICYSKMGERRVSIPSHSYFLRSFVSYLDFLFVLAGL
jgi:separase